MSNSTLILQLVAREAVEQYAEPVPMPESYGHALASFQRLLDDLPEQDLERVAAAIDRGLQTPGTPRNRQLAARLAGGDYDQAMRVRLELEGLLESFRHRRELLEGALGTEQVAVLLGTSRQTPHDRVAARTLLAIRDRGTLRFPPWQFDSEGPDGVVTGFPDVLKALPATGLAASSWFVRANPYLEDKTPIAALKGGDRDRVIIAARGVAFS